MKKWIAILLIAFMGVVWPISDALAPPQVGTTRLQDRNSANKADIEQSAVTLVNTLFGLFGLTANYYWDTTTNNWRRQDGGPTVDNVAGNSRMPRVACFEYVQDAAGNWDRKLLGTGTAAAGVRVAPPTDARFQVSDDANQNATGNRIWDNCNLDQILGTATSISTGVTDAGTQRMIPADDSPGLTTAAPTPSRIQDGNSTVLADVLDALADGLATSLNGIISASIMYASNGATLDKLILSATGGLMAAIENWPNAFDFGNARVNTFKDDINVYLPSPEGPTAIDAAVTDFIGIEVFAPKYILNTPNITVYIVNNGGGSNDNILHCYFVVSFDGTAATSKSLAGFTDCDGHASAAGSCVYQVQNSSYVYGAVECICDTGGDTTVTAYMSGNKS